MLTRSHIRRVSAWMVARVAAGVFTALLTTCSTSTGPNHAAPPKDITPPVVAVLSFDHSITSALGAHIFLPGDTMEFEVRSQDDVSLAWIGFRLSGVITLRDSIAVPDSLRHQAVGIRVGLSPVQTLSGLLTVGGFARDSAGNIADALLNGSPASFVAPVETHVPQIGFDVAGGFVMNGPPGLRRFYWVSGSKSIGVFEDGGRSTSIVLPAQGHDLDFTLQKDSLVVTIPELHEYGIIDLHPTYPTLAIVPDTVTAAQDEPWALRIVANNHAVVYRRNVTDTTVGSYVDWDLRTGRQQLVSGTIVHGGMERTADRAYLIVWETPSCCNGRAQVYAAATATFSAPVVVGATSSVGVTLEGAGLHLLVGNHLFAFPALNPLAQFQLPGVIGPTALSRDGRTLFASTAQGLLRVRVSDGVGYDLVTVGDPPPRLFATPDGSQVFMPFPSFVRYADLPTLPPRVSVIDATTAVRWIKYPVERATGAGCSEALPAFRARH